MIKVTYFQFQLFYRILDWEGVTIYKCETHFLMKKHQSMFENPMHIEIESDMIIAFSTFMERPIIVRQMMIYMHSISTH